MRKKMLFVFGTRPEAIKMCPVIKVFYQDTTFETKVCVTAQHREMLDSVLSTFDIQPDYDLNIMKKGQSLIDLSCAVLVELTRILKDYQPNLVFVHGDTSTTLYSTLASFYEKIPVAHIEAGLRTNQIYSPFPEEMNRCLVSKLASIHFAPTELNKQNLINEGINQPIFVTGNTVIDAIHYINNRHLTFHSSILQKIDFNTSKVILFTMHRRENIGKEMQDVLSALIELTECISNLIIVFPVHPNPKLHQIIQEKITKGNSRFILLDPVDYEEMILLMKKCYLVVTDSGGIQEEAPALHKPVLILREFTERVEGVESGSLKLIGTNRDTVLNEINHYLTNELSYNQMASSKNPYGDGNSSERILDDVKRMYGLE